MARPTTQGMVNELQVMMGAISRHPLNETLYSLAMPPSLILSTCTVYIAKSGIAFVSYT